MTKTSHTPPPLQAQRPELHDLSQRPAMGGSRVQLKRQMAGLGYAEQLALVDPDRERLDTGRAAASTALPVVQRKAITAGELAGTTRDGDGAIFDSPRIARGFKFKLEVEVEVPSANWTSVIGTYQTHIRDLGNVAATKEFLDKRLKFYNNLPNDNKWGQKKATFIESAKAELKMPDTISVVTKPDRSYWETLSGYARGDVNQLRNNDDIGLIDPFLVELVIKDKAKPLDPSWRFLTQFADSGSGYITAIYNGSQNLGGNIATAESFASNKAKDAANDKDYEYSSTHEQGSESFESRMAGIEGTGAGSTKKGDNSAGLDAVTWLAAEGARFAPIAKLGGVASPESHFFIKPNDDWTGYKYFTTTDLMRLWLREFDKKYGVTSEQLAAKVNAKGKSDASKPPAGWHFNLTADAKHQQT